MRILLFLLCAAASAQTLQERIAAHPRGPELAPGQEMGQEVTFHSGALVLKGFLYKPKGAGPFPVMVWNHGSEQKPGWQPELAAFYNRNGYVFFLPHRHGHGRSEGEYIVDLNNKLLKSAAREQDAWPAMVKLHDVYNTDVEASVAWIKKQPFTDTKRIFMSGCSYGGIQTILSAEKGMGVRAFVPFAPAAMSWRMTDLRERMLKAVNNAKAPVFLLQAKNDFSIGPSETLGPALRKKSPLNRSQVYPSFGPEDDHRLGHAGFACWNIGTEIWGKDVLAFLSQ
ncbi:MAG: dienelactone hydrolase family protein [Candidatus Solibacter usitatus]|nr:dienelactone hydrolase family protein [Candidatus Solibacter usitatus]